MKKWVKGIKVVILLLFVFAIIPNVEASEAQRLVLNIDGIDVTPENKTIQNGTVVLTALEENLEPSAEGPRLTYKVTLNNYHGKFINLECRASHCNKYNVYFLEIELVGENTVENIFDSGAYVSFKGSGTLVVEGRPKAPFNTTNYTGASKKFYVNPTKNIYTYLDDESQDTTQKEETSKDEDKEQKDKIEDEKNNVVSKDKETDTIKDSKKDNSRMIFIGFLVYVITTLGVILALVIKMRKKKEV